MADDYTYTVDFSEALGLLKDGHKMARVGWNGSGMWVVLRKGYPEGVRIDASTARDTGIEMGTSILFRPYLLMYTADGEFVPWVASQTDLLADDWHRVS